MYKTRLIYSAIIIAAFVFSQALYEPIAYMTFVIALVLPLVSIVFALFSYPLVRIKCYFKNADVFRFSDFIIKIVVKNNSPFISPSFRLNCFLPDDNGKELERVSFIVNSSVISRGTYEYIRFFANRGIYELRIDSIEYFDFLKLIKIKKRIGKVVSVRSKPQNIELLLPVSSEQQQNNNSTSPGTVVTNSGGDMFGVKKYVIGDSTKNIHWKLSAKNEDLIMKTFAENVYDQAIIIADMSDYFSDVKKGKSMTDCVVEAALSAMRDYSKSSVRFSLIFNTGKSDVVTIPVASPSDLHIAEDALMMTPMVENTVVTDLLKNIDINTVSGCEVCMITSFNSDELLKNIRTFFLDRKSKLKVIRISEYEMPEKDGVLSYTRELIENMCRSNTNETR